MYIYSVQGNKHGLTRSICVTAKLNMLITMYDSMDFMLLTRDL